MKKHSLLLLALASMLFAGCYPTRIVTVSPASTAYHASSTTVTIPRTQAVTTTTHVYTQDYDMCLHLDLQAVAAAFAQSSTVREFENILNSSSYMISNLDLNNDGYIDYLRVVETMEGLYTHIFVVQAVLGMNMFQDVATIVVENPHRNDCYVELIGAPFIYGPHYIVRPVFYKRPPIYTHLRRHGYTPWMSPWHWSNFPSHYRHPAPVYLSHYQAYVDTYMHNHHYCHEVNYPSSYHYANYHKASQGIQRHDFADQHPERTFTTRNANTPVSNSAVQRAANARDVRAAQQASVSRSTSAASSNSRSNTSTSATRNTNTNTGATGNSRNNASTSTSRSNTSTTGTASRNTTTGTTSSSRNTSTSAASSNSRNNTSTSNATRSSSSTSSSSSSNSGTTVRSRVNTSGTSTTTTSRGTSTTNRGTGTTSTTSSSRSTSTSSATRSGSSSSSSSSRSGSSASSSSSRSGSSSSSSASRSSSTSSAGRR